MIFGNSPYQLQAVVAPQDHNTAVHHRRHVGPVSTNGAPQPARVLLIPSSQLQQLFESDMHGVTFLGGGTHMGMNGIQTMGGNSIFNSHV